MAVFAPPGGGKGTVCGKLADDFGLVHVSSGNLFRAAIRRGDPDGLKAKTYMDAGALVPASVAHEIVYAGLVTPSCLKQYVSTVGEF